MHRGTDEMEKKREPCSCGVLSVQILAILDLVIRRSGFDIHSHRNRILTDPKVTYKCVRLRH